jgi:hypothetical protein
MAERGGTGILPGMSPPPTDAASSAPLTEFRCSTCGYGAIRRGAPHHCPMCGGTTWEEQGRKAYAAPLRDFAAGVEEAAEEDASAPLQREVWELDAGSVFPGVPLS